MSLLHPGLEAFTAIIKHSTVHGAATEIGLTQTGVTQRIRALEKHLGTTLFIRSRKGMQSTSEGDALYRYCQQAKDLEGKLLSFFNEKAINASVRVRFTGPSSIMRSRIIPAASNVLSNLKNIVCTYTLNDKQSALQYLKSGESQLGIMQRHQVVNELDSKLLRPSLYILVGTPLWKNRSIEDIVKKERIVDFSYSDDTTFQYLKQYNLFENCLRERHFANNTDALANLVTLGVGYSVLSTDFAQPFLKTGQIIDLNMGKTMKIDFALAWYPRHEMPSYFKQLIKAIK